MNPQGFGSEKVMRREGTDVCGESQPELECHLPGIRSLVYKKERLGKSVLFGLSEMFWGLPTQSMHLHQLCYITLELVRNAESRVPIQGY